MYIQAGPQGDMEGGGLGQDLSERGPSSSQDGLKWPIGMIRP